MFCLDSKCKSCTDKKDDILDAVIEVIGTDGVSALTHRNVAKRAGVSLSSTTYYFKSKEDMIRQAFDRLIKDDLLEHEGILSEIQKGNTNFEELITRVFPADMMGNPKFKLRIIAMYELMLENARNPKYNELMDQWHHAHIDLLSKIVKEEYLNYFSMFEIYSVFNGILFHMLSGVKDCENPMPYTKKYFKDFSTVTGEAGKDNG